MNRVRGRGTSRSILLMAMVTVLSVLSPRAAQGATIAQTRAAIAALSARLAQQQRTSETTANAYDLAISRLQHDRATILTLDAREAEARGAIATTSRKLTVAVVRAYVLDAADAQTLPLFNQNVTLSDARKVFEERVFGNLATLRSRYHLQKDALDRTLAAVARERSRAQHQSDTMRALLAQNARNEQATQATLTVVTRSLRAEIITYEIRAGAAAARVRDTAGEETAVAAASSVGGQSAANEVLAAIQAATPPALVNYSGSPAGSAQGMAALRAAESQIGVPYVWGGESPGHGFDCSGLVQWAWAQAGFTIPRTTEEQWPALHHVSLQDLQPGDLLFYYNLDGDNLVDHVVMYAGSGPWGTNTIIAAAHTGTTVSLAPIFTFGLIGAARP
jgi:cell wall-associated NlpC family hydrolase